MKEVVLKTNNLTKQYNKNVVLDNVNITINTLIIKETSKIS